MSASKSRRFLRRRAAAALALFAVVAVPQTVASAATRTLYQKQINLVCDGSVDECEGGFQLSANQRLELEQVICLAGLNSTGQVYTAAMTYPIVGGNQFRYYLSLDSKAYTGVNTYIYMFGQDGLFLVPTGKRLTATVNFNGPSTPFYVICSLHGTLVTLN